MKSRIISLILVFSLFSATIPVFAENTDINEVNEGQQVEETSTIQEEAPTPIPQNDTYYEVDEDEGQDEILPEPKVHTETLPDDFQISEEEYNLMGPRLPQAGEISLFSTTNNYNEIWSEMLAEQFGDTYLKPYEKNEGGQIISGNTNRLTIEETDLSLPGKNGLDVEIIRKHDNQDYDDIYSAYQNRYDETSFVRKYLYAFKNKENNNTIYIAFYTEDDFYTYMYNGCYLKPLDNRKMVSYTIDGTKYTYYNFSYVFEQISEDMSDDYYEYDNSFERIDFYERYAEGAGYAIMYRTLLKNRNSLGNNWRLLLPEVYLCKYSYTIEQQKEGQNGEYKDYCGEYYGAFRDLYGNVYLIDGNDTYRKYAKPEYHDNTYTSSFKCSDNHYLELKKIFKAETLEDGTQYNFTVRDKRGLTYYLFNPQAENIENPRTNQPITIMAIKDDYGNTIRYKHDDVFEKTSQIIDTYGREININYFENKTVISYCDDITGETKNITYENSTLPSSALDNDSPIKQKDVKRLTVTNQIGEKTIYDARETEVISVAGFRSCGLFGYPGMTREPAERAKNSNIERIIYPTGAETRYKYKHIFLHNSESRVNRGVYAVESSYDIVDGKEVNKNNYSFVQKGEITITKINDDAQQKTEQTYNEYGLLKSETISPIESVYPRDSITYSYDDCKKPTRKIINKNNVSYDINYSYSGGYPNRLLSESTDNKRIIYAYHESTDKPQTVTYQYKSGENYETDYIISTELTSDNKAIEYERVTKDNIIKSQTKYEYDTEGNVIAAKQWTSDTNGDGVLNENDAFNTVSSSYVNTDQKTKNVTNSVADVKNADGVNEGSINNEFKFNIYGSPIYNKDSYNTVTTIEYDDLNRPVKYNLPNGGTKTIEYVIDSAAKNSYSIVTDEVGIQYKNIYDGIGRIKEKYRYDGYGWNKLESYMYDNSGRLTEKTSGQSSASSIREVYTYDELNRVVEKKVYEGLYTLKYTENYTYSRDSETYCGVITKTVTASDGTQSAVSKTYYDEYGNTVKTEAVSEDTTLTTTYEYDYLGRKIKETDPNGNSTQYEYNYDGQISKVTDALGRNVTTQYDLAGQAISVTDAKGNTTITDYDKIGRAIKVTAPFDSGRNAITKTYYDKNSNIVKTSVRKDGNVYQSEEYKYDNMGNLIAAIAGDGAEKSVVQYQYDTANRMTKMITGLTDYSANPTGGAETTYEYGKNGFLSKVTDPMGKSEEYTGYDNYGNIQEKIDRVGNVIVYRYGMYGIVLEDTYVGGRNDTTYNSLGQITKTVGINRTGEKVETSYTYDMFGRVTSKTSADGTVQNYTYDNNSNVLSYDMVKDDITQNSVTYKYNSLNQLTTLTNNDIITSYEYDANGNLTKQALNNGLTTNYTYNNAGLISRKESKKGISTYTYSNCSYLLNGLLSQVTMPYDGNNENESKTKTYEYDSLGRLTNERIAEAAGIPLNSSYTYDSFGNRVQKVENHPDDSTTTTINYQYDLNNRLIHEDSETYNEYSNTGSSSATQYYYDDNGNMLAEQKKTYTTGNESSNMSLSGRTGGGSLKLYQYDMLNRLIRYNDGETEAAYTYGADNLRASKTVNGIKTDFVWNGQNLAGETENGITNTYTYDMTGVHIANQNGVVISYLKDYHGNVVAKANKSGSMIDEIGNRRDYDAFGNQWQGTTSDPFGYCGEYYDEENGLTYLRNRYYDSVTGKFITEDPIKDGLNWYAYCEGNPVMFYDPSGFGIIDDALDKEYDNISYYEEKISSLDLSKYEDEELSYRYQDEIETSRSIIKNILDNTIILNVPEFCQYNTINGGELCWACCESMIIAYLKGDCIDRTYDIAKDANCFTSRRWYSCEKNLALSHLG